MGKRAIILGFLVLAAAGIVRADSSMLTMEEIKTLVNSGHYKDAQPAIYRALALQGQAAAAYDRYELFMLRAECQLQSKDQTGAIASLEQAKKEAVAARQFAKLAPPTALAALLQKSSLGKFVPKAGPKEGLPILDPAQRPAAFAALFAEEFPAAKAKVDTLNNAKTMTPILEAAKLVGTVRAVEMAAQAEGQAEGHTGGQTGGKVSAPQTSPLTGVVTNNADRLFTAALDDFNKQCTTIGNNAQQVIHDTVPVYDPNSKKSWMQPRVRRRGPSDAEVATLKTIITNCDKIHASAAELAATLNADFDLYQGVAVKADTAKGKAVAILSDDYSQVP